MRTSVWLLAAVACGLGGVALAEQGDGLLPANDGLTWPRWQGRLSVSSVTPRWQAPQNGDTADAGGLKINGLIGDYYFSRRLAETSRVGGFRATSGLVLASSRTALWIGQPQAATRSSAFNVERSLFGASTSAQPDGTVDSSSTVPYFGFGYSGMSIRGGWSYSADFGLMALNPGSAVKLGRVFNGNQNLDDLLREMRLAPVLQLGVSYAF